MNVRYVVGLTPEQRRELEALVAKGTTRARRLKRAQVRLAADAGTSDGTIAATIGVSAATIYRLKRRCVERGVERTAPLPTDAADAVDRWLECRKRLGLTGRQPLFCTLKGEPLWDSYVRTLCKRLAAKAGVEKRVHPHGFRHGWALGQVESGTSLPVSPAARPWPCEQRAPREAAGRSAGSA